MVENIVYIGSNVTNKLRFQGPGIIRRPTMARSTTQNMVRMWRSRGICTVLEVRVLRATAFAIAA